MKGTTLKLLGMLAMTGGVLLVVVGVVIGPRDGAPAGASPAPAASNLPPPLLLLDRAKRDMPNLLNAMYRALDEGNPQAAQGIVAPELLADGRKLDRIARPFTYRAHYVEAFLERPGGDLEVRVRALFKPVEERAYTFLVRAAGVGLVVVDVADASDEWRGSLEAQAADVARRFVYAVTAGSRGVVDELVTPGVDVSRVFRPDCQATLQSFKDVELGSGRATLKDYKGLKAFVNFNFFSWGLESVVVDRIAGESKVVKFRTPCSVGGSRIEEEDPGLEDYTLTRFGLKADLSR